MMLIFEWVLIVAGIVEYYREENDQLATPRYQKAYCGTGIFP